MLIVTKLDRLGRNAIDVATTVAKLAEMGVRVHCLTLGGVDLTSPAGRMTMGVINSVAHFERDLLIERTQSGLKRAKAAGEVFGRPPTLTGSSARGSAGADRGRCQRVGVGEAVWHEQADRHARQRCRPLIGAPHGKRINHCGCLDWSGGAGNAGRGPLAAPDRWEAGSGRHPDGPKRPVDDNGRQERPGRAA